MSAAMDRRQQSGSKTLAELFVAEPDRLSRLSFELCGIYFDWSKTHLDAAEVEEFAARAEKMKFAEARDTLFSGGISKPSGGRAATPVVEWRGGSPDDLDLG